MVHNLLIDGFTILESISVKTYFQDFSPFHLRIIMSFDFIFNNI